MACHNVHLPAASSIVVPGSNLETPMLQPHLIIVSLLVFIWCGHKLHPHHTHSLCLNLALRILVTFNFYVYLCTSDVTRLILNARSSWKSWRTNLGITPPIPHPPTMTSYLWLGEPCAGYLSAPTQHSLVTVVYMIVQYGSRHSTETSVSYRGWDIKPGPGISYL